MNQGYFNSSTCSLRVFYRVFLIVDGVGVSSPPTAVTGSPHSHATCTPGSPVASSVSSTTTVENAAVKTPPTHHSPGEQTTAATPPTADQAAKGV